MSKTVIFGNSGSGKSTLAKQLSASDTVAHMDLDAIAWLPSTPPTRAPLEQSKQHINAFIQAHNKWVIEGCYADLIELVMPMAEHLVFMNLPIEACIANARARPWEPHKYPSKAEQDANLAMLIEWIEQYATRTDEFSQCRHQQLYDDFGGSKTMVTANNQYNSSI
ncbi:AAA family ATPase [Alteromonas sp. ASW11-36]|uniref:AAA family ATPase n=1 Tax=Alteromonas arenosi TaxID=3055817 RepID=A0ABT7T1J4_9ALTE|nr:AAA family ATPase [Alteromonas sp. ASW11-36]MDM7862318.1 AAA family ATPase [Alteromonas sp. ASW11-36]